MNILFYLLLIVVLLVGWLIVILGLPGLWLMVIALVGYAFATGWDVFVGWQSIAALAALAFAAELVEFFAGAAGSAAAGGRKRGILGAIVGGFIGGIVGTPFLPIVGSIVGSCVGACIGAAAMEMTDRDPAHSLRIGIGAAKGRFWGIVGKLIFGLAMFVVAVWAAFPAGGVP